VLLSKSPKLTKGMNALSVGEHRKPASPSFMLERPPDTAPFPVPLPFKEIDIRQVSIASFLSAFRPWRIPGPTSKLSLRVPAQMGRRETEHKGERREPRLVLSYAQGECACSRGLQAFAREGESLFVSPSSRAATVRTRALNLPFIDVRRRPRCTMGGVAMC
jgi:hypothetical protein